MTYIPVRFEVRTGSIGAAVLRKGVERVLRGEKLKAGTVSIALVDDATIHAVNKKFLGHDCATDVITFPLETEPLDAEIVISVETARRQAREFKVSLKEELLRLVIHGTLHLAGWRDASGRDREKMRDRENYYIQKLIK
ncbi:MAG: rRNA maturation RNase YbeY [Chlorobi bacterium]|nr:rRNA maturation RNase YbeY [Chlorobiota bacterium]